MAEGPRHARVPLLALALVGVYASGCGTLSGFNQRVKLATTPDGALVIDEDDEQIGESNDFLLLDRSRSTELTLARAGYLTRELELKTSYRWGESFAANLFWIVTGPWGPPIGWALDFLSGSAWEYEEIGIIPLEPIRPGYAVTGATKPRVVAVTPPVADFELLSEEIADRLALDFAESHPGDRLLPLEETGDLFTTYGWDHETYVDDDFADALVDELDATHVLESAVEETDSGVRVSVAVVNVFTDEVEESFQLEYTPDEIESSQHGWLARTLLSVVTIIPNSVALDVRAPTASVVATAPGPSGDVSYNGSLVPSNPWLLLLSGLRVRNVRSSAVRSDFGVGFELAPLVGLFWDRFEFEPAEGTEGGPSKAEFDWYGMTVGFGPEVGLETPLGYVYLGLYPQWGVHATVGGFAGEKSETLWQTMWQLEAELGYLFFITRNFHMRLFARVVGVAPGFWERSFAGAGRGDIAVETAQFITGGISFGYFSPRIRNLTKRSLL